MKKVLLLFLLFSSGFIFSQANPIGRPTSVPLGLPVGIQNGLDGNLFNFYNSSSYAKIDYAMIQIPKENHDIQGSPYAFKGWNNRGLLKVDSRDYKLNNLNFNMYTNTIEAKVGIDSVYIFDLVNVDYAFINNKKFKNFYVSDRSQNKIFEMIYDSDDFQILKGYNVLIKKGEVDPLMVKKKKAKYVTDINYYVKEGNSIKKITLKKKVVLLLFKDKSTLVSNFVKENKLSYKKDQDLKNIFAYYKQL